MTAHGRLTVECSQNALDFVIGKLNEMPAISRYLNNFCGNSVRKFKL